MYEQIQNIQKKQLTYTDKSNIIENVSGYIGKEVSGKYV